VGCVRDRGKEKEGREAWSSGGSLVRWFVGSVVRWFGGSVVRWFGGAVERRKDEEEGRGGGRGGGGGDKLLGARADTGDKACACARTRFTWRIYKRNGGSRTRGDIACHVSGYSWFLNYQESPGQERVPGDLGARGLA
jgi:hypothetical protein